MRISFYFIIVLLSITTGIWGQVDAPLIRDSVYVDQGVAGTTDFEAKTRLYFVRYDEQGRVLEQLREVFTTQGVWSPQSRRMFTYVDDQLSTMHIQMWSISNNNWIDQRRDQYTYEAGLLKEHLRQKAPQGQLENERRWLYTYNADEEETKVVLQQWDGGNWQNLSQKLLEYTGTGDPLSQILQVWMNDNWRNVRSREWEYEMAGNQSRERGTLVKLWSVADGDWILKSRKLFFYNNDGIWVRSRSEDWNEDTQEWVSTSRMIYAYNGENQPIGQALQNWDGAWENNGQVSYTFQDKQFLSRIETWDKVTEKWTNFLRYQVKLDDQNLLQSSTGMQSWDTQETAWVNRNYTRRATHFWSQEMVNNVEEINNTSACFIPNPYSPGTYFFCDLPPTTRPYQLELYDMLGRPVYQTTIQAGETATIDKHPPSGIYVLRIHDQQQLYHLQKLIIP